jgi:hypothetical protein
MVNLLIVGLIQKELERASGLENGVNVLETVHEGICISLSLLIIIR